MSIWEEWAPWRSDTHDVLDLLAAYAAGYAGQGTNSGEQIASLLHKHCGLYYTMASSLRRFRKGLEIWREPSRL